MKIQEKLYGYRKEGINPTKGRIRRDELRGWPKELGAYPHQQSAIEKKYVYENLLACTLAN